MSSSRRWYARWSKATTQSVPVLCFASALGGAPSTAEAVAPPSDVVRVEEDWQLVVKTPDNQATAPQVTTLISPVARAEKFHAIFELNHRSLPTYQPGGLQLQTWHSGAAMSVASTSNASVMSQQNEEVTWTSAMDLTSGTLTIEVLNGASTTWGTFGTANELQVNVPTELANLNGHDPDVSVANSGVGFAGNRVASLALVRSRRYLDNGTVVVDSTRREVQLPQ